MTFPLEGVVTVQPTSAGHKAHDFEFDNVFAPGTSQEVSLWDIATGITPTFEMADNLLNACCQLAPPMFGIHFSRDEFPR